MHPNPAFRASDRARDVAFARERGFGTLMLNGEVVPLISHVPFLLTEDGASADLHLVRSNPIARMVSAPMPAVIAATGPDGYVSPDWYDVDDQVPTWNYIAVHLIGTLARLPEADMRDTLDRQSADLEVRLLPKRPWTTSKMTGDVRDRMMRQILPFRLAITEIRSTWKLSQNKPDAVRLRAAKAMSSGTGQELRALSDLMRDPPGD